MRKTRQFIWVSPDDCIPPHGLYMDEEYHYNKVAWLREQFIENGFNRNHSALVGYPLDGKIQLLSGTHRHRAAQEIGMQLPVTLWLRSDVERLWGTPDWKRLIEDIPVNKLEDATVKEGFCIPPYEPVVLTKS